jgi:hypothetical protein
VNIGRHDGDPYPEIILRGVGIQKNHAQIVLNKKGEFTLVVHDKECWEQTLVNGKRLEENNGENHEEYSTTLNHLDRIFIGVNTMFLFKYPLKKDYRKNVENKIHEQNPGLDDDEIKELVDHYINNFEL